MEEYYIFIGIYFMCDNKNGFKKLLIVRELSFFLSRLNYKTQKTLNGEEFELELNT